MQWILQYTCLGAHIDTFLVCIYLDVKYIDQRFCTRSAFSKFCQFVFQSGCTNFHPHLKYTIAPNPLQHLIWSDGTLGHFVLFLKVMLVDLEWYVMVILFAFFIDYWNQILLFVYWPFEYIPLWNIFHIFCIVFYWVIYLFLKYLLDFLISYGYKSFVGYLIFISLLRLSILLRLFKEPSLGLLIPTN